MAVFEAAVLTTQGNELLIDSVAGAKIEFTRMVVGGGNYTQEERVRRALEERRVLKDAKQEFTFSTHKKVSPQCVLLTAVISNANLEHGYKITEVGIYGKRAGDAEDFLCSIAITKSMEESDTFPPYNGLQECQIVQDYYITISPDAEITVVTKGACVLTEEFERKIMEIEKSKLDNNGNGSNLIVEFSPNEKGENIESGTKLSVMMGIIHRVIQSFQDGVNKIYNYLKGLGFTPNPNSPDGICAAIQKVYDLQFENGRNQGRQDVIDDPDEYGVTAIPKFFYETREIEFTVDKTPKSGKIGLNTKFSAHSSAPHNANGFSINILKNNVLFTEIPSSTQGFTSDYWGENTSGTMSGYIDIPVVAGDVVKVQGNTGGYVKADMIIAWYF